MSRLNYGTYRISRNQAEISSPTSVVQNRVPSSRSEESKPRSPLSLLLHLLRGGGPFEKRVLPVPSVPSSPIPLAAALESSSGSPGFLKQPRDLRGECEATRVRNQETLLGLVMLSRQLSRWDRDTQGGQACMSTIMEHNMQMLKFVISLWIVSMKRCS